MPNFSRQFGNELHVDIHTSKLNLAAWIRRNKNMREPVEIANALKHSYDFLYDCAYNYTENGVYNIYLANPPETVDKSIICNRETETGKMLT